MRSTTHAGNVRRLALTTAAAALLLAAACLRYCSALASLAAAPGATLLGAENARLLSQLFALHADALRAARVRRRDTSASRQNPRAALHSDKPSKQELRDDPLDLPPTAHHPASGTDGAADGLNPGFEQSFEEMEDEFVLRDWEEVHYDSDYADDQSEYEDASNAENGSEYSEGFGDGHWEEDDNDFDEQTDLEGEVSFADRSDRDDDSGWEDGSSWQSDNDYLIDDTLPFRSGLLEGEVEGDALSSLGATDHDDEDHDIQDVDVTNDDIIDLNEELFENDDLVKFEDLHADTVDSLLRKLRNGRKKVPVIYGLEEYTVPAYDLTLADTQLHIGSHLRIVE